MRHPFFSFVLSLSFLFFSGAAFSCVRACESIENLYKDSLIVFEGEVKSNKDPTKIQIEVTRFYKGIPKKIVSLDLANNGTSCDRTVREQEKYMIFAGGPNLDNLRIMGCSPFLLPKEGEISTVPPLPGAAHIEGIVAPKFTFLETREKIGSALLDAILEQRKDSDALTRVRAEDLLYWHDYQNAELVLEQILYSKPDDIWAINELMNVLYNQQKIQKIWNTYQLIKLRNGYDLINRNLSWDSIAKAVSLTSLVSNNQFGFSLRFMLEDINLRGLEKSGADARDALLDKVTMREGRLPSVNFSKARIANSHFDHMDFSKAIFMDAHFAHTGFYFTNFEGADLRRAVVFDGKFRHVNFKDALLTDAKFVETDYDCETIWPEGFDPIAAGAKPAGKCK